MAIDIGTIKANNPLEQTIESLTGEEVTKHKIRCPFHEDSSPSLHVYDDGGWKCFGCGKHGDVIDFFGYFYFGEQYNPDTHFIEIIDRIGALDIKPLPQYTTRPKPEKQKRRLSIDLETIMHWHESMPDNRRAYWHGRGLADRTIDEFFLGWDGKRYTIPALYRLQPFGVKRRIAPEQWDRELSLYNDAIDKLKALHPDWTDQQIKKEAPALPVKYLQTTGGRVGIFNADNLWTATTAIICEGEIDAMLLSQAGYCAVSSTGGAGTWKDDWAKFFSHICHVSIIYDNDEAGRDGANKVRSTMRRAKILTLPTGVKDIGELYAAGAAESWLYNNIGRE